MNIVAAILVSGLLMTALWQTFDPRVFVFFAFFLSIAEMFVQMSWRLSIVCKVCGFDPVLYRRAPEEAAAKVRERLEARKREPGSWLAKPIHLPALPAERAEELRKLEERKKARPGALVSKSI